MRARKMDPDRLRTLHAAGRSDVEIGREMGVHKQTVMEWRHRLGLPSRYGAGGTKPDSTRERARAVYRERVAAVPGARSLREVCDGRRAAAAAALARRYNLPADLPPRAVQIVLALVAGPRTATSLARAIGWGHKTTRSGSPIHLFQRPKLKPGGNYLCHLTARGLVAVIRVPPARVGVGESPALYSLTDMALTLLEGA